MVGLIWVLVTVVGGNWLILGGGGFVVVLGCGWVVGSGIGVGYGL